MPVTAIKTKSGARKPAAGTGRERGTLKALAPVPGASRASGAPPTAASASQRSSQGEGHHGQRQNEGHGRRLTSAFEALEAFPALAESRNRLLAVVEKDHVATADVVSAVESDVALIIAVLRLANRAREGRTRVDTAVTAVEVLSPHT